MRALATPLARAAAFGTPSSRRRGRDARRHRASATTRDGASASASPRDERPAVFVGGVEIEDIVANPQTKQLSAVISVGGFLGMGQKQVLIPFDRLRLGDNDVILMSQQDEEQHESMPTYREGADYRRIEGNQRLGEWNE